MNKIQKALMSLLASAIHENRLSIPELSETEWNSLYKEAREHGVHLMIIYALNKQNVVFGDEILRKAWKDILYMTTLYHISSLAKLSETLDKLSQLNIPIMYLKGFYFRTLYPKPELRVMGDIDLLVKKADFKSACSAMIELGYTHYEDNHSTLHNIYTRPNCITIEIHHSLITDSLSKSQKTFEQMIWDEYTVRNIDGRPCIIPSEVNHTIYCFMHMLNHLHSSGFGLRQLCDLILLIKHDTSFNWNEFFLKAEMLKIHNFVSSVLWICNTYLNLVIPDKYLPKIHLIESDKTEMLMDQILRSGEFGTRDQEYLISKNMAEYQIDTAPLKPNNLLHFLLPSRKLLKPFYGYAHKFWFLLPVAWIHRIILNIVRKDLSLREKLPNRKIMLQHKELVKWLNQK